MRFGISYRYKITIEYIGTNLHGWQRLRDDHPSVQLLLEKAIERFTGEEVHVYGSGRTDAGVHAIGQVAHFDLKKHFSIEKVIGACNHFLKPHLVGITNCELVDNKFHARFSAKKRFYKYRIINREAKIIIEKDRAWHIRKPLDLESMIYAAKMLEGTHDFTSFRAKACQAPSPIKTLDHVNIIIPKPILNQTDEFKSEATERILIREYSRDLKNSSVSFEMGNGISEYDNIDIYFEGKSYLYHMVRNIVGTLVEIGLNKLSPSDITKILEAKDRAAAGVTAPACGLYFLKVDY